MAQSGESGGRGPRGNTFEVPAIVLASGAYALGAFAAGRAAAGFGASGRGVEISEVAYAAVGVIAAAAAGAGLAARRRIVAVALMAVAFGGAGAFAARVRHAPEETVLRVAEKDPREPVVLEGFVIAAPERGERDEHVVVEVIGAASGLLEELQPARGRARLAILDEDSDPRALADSSDDRDSKKAARRDRAIGPRALADSIDDRDSKKAARRDRALAPRTLAASREHLDSPPAPRSPGAPRRDHSRWDSCGAPGDRVRVWARVRAPEPPLFPGDSGEAPALWRRGISVVGFARSPDDCIVVAHGELGGFRIALERVRDRIHRAIDRDVSPDVAPIVRAFATGDRSGIPAAIDEDFSASGLAHLLAVSGLNLAIVAGLFLLGLERVFRRIPSIALGFGARRTAAIIAAPFVVAYTLLVGVTPSALRAALMVSVLLAAHLFARVRDLRAAIALAALVMLAADPAALFDLSLQLSFAAVAALFILYPPIHKRLRTLPALARWPLEIAAASAVATIGTAPLTAAAFDRLSLAGIVANIPAHPLSTLILVPVSLAGALLSLVSDAAAAPFFAVAEHSSRLLIAVARTAADLPAAAVRVPHPNLLEQTLFYAAAIALASRRPKLALACAAAIALELGALELTKPETLRVAFLPVGQGDAAIVELPNGEVFAIDTGPPPPSPNKASAAERVILRYLAERRIRAIDRLILTHPHVDHTGGLAALTRAIPIREVWWTGDTREGPPELAVALAAIPTRIVDAPFTEHHGETELEVLGPIGAAHHQKIVNDGSIAIRLTYKTKSILLTGDAEAAEERAILESRQPIRADVLKLGHHGSKTSSTEAFLDAVQPAHAIASAGRNNRFRFPHRPIVDRLRDRNITLHRTDQNGAILVETDGTTLTVEDFTTPEPGARTLPPPPPAAPAFSRSR